MDSDFDGHDHLMVDLWSLGQVLSCNLHGRYCTTRFHCAFYLGVLCNLCIVLGPWPAGWWVPMEVLP